MNYGLYLSASGVLTNMYRQDVLANNLANVETVGFKADLPTARQRQPASVEGGFGRELRHQLDKLGGGTLAGAQRIDFTPGPLKETHGNLDAALDAPDTFFAVSVPGANGAQPAVRLTRDGRFAVRDGYLVTATSGHRVLDANGGAIPVADAGSLRLDAAGHVIQNGETVGQLQITSVDTTDRLKKQGQNLFTWDGQQDPRKPAASPSIHPGMVEGSGVDPIRTLIDLMDTTKAITNSANMIRYHDQMMDRAVNTLGRVA